MAYTQVAKAAGDARFAGEESAVKTAQQLAALQAAAEQQTLNQWGQTGAQSINTSFDQLLSEMGANRARAMDVLNTQAQNVGVGYDQTAEGNLAVRDESRDYLARLMGNYGMGDDVVADVQDPMEQLTNRLVERNTRYGQDARTNMGNWAAQHDVLYGDQEVNARGAQAFQQKAFQSQVGNQLAEALTAQREREIQFQSALQALAAQRGGFEVEYAQNAADRDSARSLQAAEMQMRANLAQAELAARANEFNASQAFRQQDNAWDRERFAQTHGLDQRKQDFAEWMAQQEAGGEMVDPWASGGILGMRQYAEQVGQPGLFNQADQALNAASRRAPDPSQIPQMAQARLRQPKPQYGRIGGVAGQPGMWEKPSNYEDLVNMIAIGTRR